MVDPACPMQSFIGTRILGPRHGIASSLRTVKGFGSVGAEKDSAARSRSIRLIVTWKSVNGCLLTVLASAVTGCVDRRSSCRLEVFSEPSVL